MIDLLAKARRLVPVVLCLPAVLAAQQAPADVAAVETKGAATISWTVVSPKVSYRVVRAPDPESRGIDLVRPLRGTVTSFVDQTVAPGITYFYSVIAVYGDGTEGASAPVKFALAAAPAPPPAPAPAPPPPPMSAPTRAAPTATLAAPVATAVPTRAAPAGTLAAPVPTAAPSRAAPTGTLAAPVPTTAPPRGVVSQLAAPPAPTGLSVTGNPAGATVVWTPVPGVASYLVARKEGNVPTQQATIPATRNSWYDVGLRPSTSYIYMVDAIYSGGREASTEIPFTTPPAINPQGLTARQTGPGQVQLNWQAVGGASYYVVLGPGSSYGGVKVNGQAYTVTGVPAGPQAQSWAVGSYYEPGPVRASAAVGPNAVSTPATAFPTVQLVVTPPPPTPAVTARHTSFDPARFGFLFVNDFHNSFIGPPFSVTTNGLCGGMSYTVLDYYNSGRPIPTQDYRPANNTTLQQYLYGRQVTSLAQNVDKWAETSINPGGARTQEFFNWGMTDRLTELRSYIDRGVPVPLGLKGTGPALDHTDHQVLAIGYDLGRYKSDLGQYQQDVKIFILDPNYPGKTMTLVPNVGAYEYYEAEVPKNHWRTYFVDGKYTPMVPPVIATPAYPADGLAHELLFNFTTGADDMRGGADHVDVKLTMTNNATQYFPNISQGGIWLPGYEETARVVLMWPVALSAIKTIEVSTNAGGGLNGDNWDMESMQVYPVGVGLRRTLLTMSAGPYRFTGARTPLVVVVK